MEQLSARSCTEEAVADHWSPAPAALLGRLLGWFSLGLMGITKLKLWDEL